MVSLMEKLGSRLGGPGERGRSKTEGKEKSSTLLWAELQEAHPLHFIHPPSNSLASDVETEAWRGSASPAGQRGLEWSLQFYHPEATLTAA